MLFAVELLKNNNRDTAIEITSGVIASMNIEKAFLGTQVSKLKSVDADADADDTFQAICLGITAACQYFNIGKNMNVIQVNMTAELILEQYWYLKLEEILLVFKNAMKLKYGKLFDRIDGGVIMGWISEYDINERGYILEKNATQKRKEVETDDSLPVEAFKEIYKEFIKEEEVNVYSSETDYKDFRKQYEIKRMKEINNTLNGDV